MGAGFCPAGTPVRPPSGKEQGTIFENEEAEVPMEEDEEGLLEHTKEKNCPICSKMCKNLLLHINRSKKCQDRISESDLAEIKRKAEERDRAKLNERMRNCRKREKENDPESCKVAQNEWKSRSRSRKKNEDPEAYKVAENKWTVKKRSICIAIF